MKMQRQRSLVVAIDYDEGEPDSYRGIVVTRGGEVVAEWRSGNPPADWAAFRAWGAETGAAVMETSSLTHFVQDVPGWRFILDEAGAEILVEDPEDERLSPGIDQPGP